MEGTKKKKNADQGGWKGLEKIIFFARSPFSPKASPSSTNRPFSAKSFSKQEIFQKAWLKRRSNNARHFFF
jgi:hypothetical protein